MELFILDLHPYWYLIQVQELLLILAMTMLVQSTGGTATAAE
jgi:hypothetical protein